MHDWNRKRKKKRKKMSQTRSSEPSHDPLKASKLFALPEKPADLFVLLMRLGLLVCLVASISLALHSAFSTRTRWFSFPERLSRNVSRFTETGPTNISHILFGLAGATHTWHERSRYSKLWWEPNTTRGYYCRQLLMFDIKSNLFKVLYKPSI